jgi:hypothetical protein
MFSVSAPQPCKASAALAPTTSSKGARLAKGDGVSTSFTGDKTHDKYIEMLYDTLALKSGFRTVFPPHKLGAQDRRYTPAPLPFLVGGG